MTPTLQTILHAVAHWTETTAAELRSGGRPLALARARQIYYTVGRRYGYSYPEIGKACSYKDHATVMHGVAKIEAAIAQGDGELGALVATIENEARANLPQPKRAPVIWWPCCAGAGEERCA
jgi:chromosomal replication initiation ATPase DnaA